MTPVQVEFKHLRGTTGKMGFVFFFPFLLCFPVVWTILIIVAKGIFIFPKR